MTKAEAAKKADALRLFMNEQNLAQADIARMLDVSSSKISQFLANKYPGNLDELVNKVVNLINSYDRKSRQDRGPQFVDTAIAKKIGALIANTEAACDDEGKIAVIIGDAGSGKTRCLQAYAEANKNSIYVQLDSTMYSTLIFAAMAKELHLDSSGSLATVTQRLVEHLQNRHIIIILDESSSLNVSQLNQLRQIIVCKSRCPLILAGNGDLAKTILLPTTRRGFESLDQLRSRLTGILDLSALAGNKDGGLYTPEDIRKLYEYGGVRLTQDAISLLRQICKSPGSGRMRTCQYIITALHTAGVAQITAALIYKAIKQLDLPVKSRLPVEILEDQNEETQAMKKSA
ncbi:MAG: AAA family ATPase [Sedimentisphaerales bacterium]